MHPCLTPFLRQTNPIFCHLSSLLLADLGTAWDEVYLMLEKTHVVHNRQH